MSAYEPPASASLMPGVILWYRVYALAMVVLYLASGASLYVTRATIPTMFPLVAGVSALLYAAAAFIPLTPRGWTIGLVAISFGIFCGVFPAAIALLIYWNKPLTKAAFGRL